MAQHKCCGGGSKPAAACDGAVPLGVTSPGTSHQAKDDTFTVHMPDIGFSQDCACMQRTRNLYTSGMKGEVSSGRSWLVVVVRLKAPVGHRTAWHKRTALHALACLVGVALSSVDSRVSRDVRLRHERPRVRGAS